MRVMAVHPGPHFSVADVHNGWVQAFRKLGVQLVDFNLHDRLNFYTRAEAKGDDGRFMRLVSDEGAIRLASKGLEAACWEFQPDVLFVTSCFFVPPDLLDVARARGIKVVILHTEEPYEHDRQFARGHHADLNILNDPTYLERWRTIGAAEYFPHAYDPDVHRPRPAKPQCRSDFAFVGTGYPGRVWFFEQVDWDGIDAAFAGHWQHLSRNSPLRKFLAHDISVCCDNSEAVDLYAATKASANLYRTESERPELSEGWAVGPREVELAACGTWFLREPRGEGDDLFPMLPTFNGPEEFGEKLRWWLAHDEQREQAALAARHAVTDRTFDANARRLLALLSD